MSAPLLWRKGWDQFSPHIEGWCGICLSSEIDAVFAALKRGEIAQPTAREAVCIYCYTDWSDT